MSTLTDVYRGSLALLTDLYQLTMAYGYWRAGLADTESVFHLTFRKSPFGGGYALACGLATAAEHLAAFRFDASDVEHLATLRGNDGAPLFDRGYLDVLSSMRLSLDVDAVPEGTVVFPHEPLVRVRGPILQAQLVETALLTVVNFQTLVATKAARVCHAAKGDPVLEFGLRRAQGIDGGLSASRAAYVGGCAATSNVLAGKHWGIPVRGTHAHAWVMLFDDELESFRRYADAMPNNCVFLVDTYDTRQGVRNAITVGRELAARGHRMIGIRLDSGDLAELAKDARKMLDEAGFADAAIVASNDLDEHLVESLKVQGAPIGIWGVGTRLVTGGDQPALGGVYKLAAIRDAQGGWVPKLKVSEQTIKISTPGVLQTRRFRGPEGHLADVVWDESHPEPDRFRLVDAFDSTRRREIPAGTPYEDLLVPVFHGGSLVGPLPDVHVARARAQEQIAALPAAVRRFLNPHSYPVGLEEGLHDRKTELILQARKEAMLLTSSR